MKQKSSLKDRLVGSRYFSFGITLSLFVLLYVVGMMNYRGFMKPQVFCNLLIDNAALIIATIGMLLYIWLRFQNIRFAGSSVLALIHDVLVCRRRRCCRTRACPRPPSS